MKAYSSYVGVFLLWVGLHFMTSRVTWSEVLGVGIICGACALMKND